MSFLIAATGQFSAGHWILVIVLTGVLLAVDLLAFPRRSKVGTLEAATWTGIWIGAAGLFALYLWLTQGRDLALAFAAGYGIEKAMCVENVLVWALILDDFAVHEDQRRRALLIATIGAIAFRCLVIFFGRLIPAEEAAAHYIMGLVFIGLGLAAISTREHKETLGARIAARIAARASDTESNRLFIGTKPTLFGASVSALILSDLVFAMTVPLMLATLKPPLLVFASNVFAILGMRGLYYLLVNLSLDLKYLKPGLALAFAFVGLVLVSGAWLHLPATVTAGVVLVIICGSIGASVVSRFRGSRELHQ